MPDYLEIFGRQPGERSEARCHELDFSSDEVFEAANHDRTVVDLAEHGVTVYFRYEDPWHTYLPNTLGTALLWMWYGGSSIVPVYGQMAVTGPRRGPDLRPTPVGEQLADLLAGREKITVELAMVEWMDPQYTASDRSLTDVVLEVFTAYEAAGDTRDPHAMFEAMANRLAQE